VPIADVAQSYTELVTTVSSTIAAEAWFATSGADPGRRTRRRGHRNGSGAAGRGVMPAGPVSRREEADVVAYVVSISSPGD
jgi:hypothetical protein